MHPREIGGTPYLVDLVHPVIQVGLVAVVEQGSNPQGKQVLPCQPLEEVVLKHTESALESGTS